MSAGSGPMAGLVLGWESGTQRGWGRARASLLTSVPTLLARPYSRQLGVTSDVGF
ncbi:hypothetical protein OOU_Y34scaffold00433g29 [Pyricularia oryzae Y34]|uniref:Uncharacterized protein n=2 Tax=Pyricularia oryzae TaxID=318829 RepID=A0AA97P221_PYRO3|nr:hypothetical protein OOU_Y34scaffold00433g29 [Pyricularia oryzae Y34]